MRVRQPEQKNISNPREISLELSEQKSISNDIGSFNVGLHLQSLMAAYELEQALLQSLNGACKENNILRITSLLASVDLLSLTSDSELMFSVLMSVQSVEALHLILNAAQQRGCINELLSVKNKFGDTFFEWICFEANSSEKIPLLTALIENENFRKIANFYDVSHWARSAYLHHPSAQAKFDQICSLIRRAKWERKNKVADLDMDAPTPSTSYYCNMVSGKPEISIVNSKEAAIERALVEIAALLDNPKKCIKYLSILSKEFGRYFNEKYWNEFGPIGRNTYKFCIIDGTYYPIPTVNYKSLEKHNALQKFLISWFRQYGLAENAFEWNGFIPKEVANEMLKNGDFITQGRVDSSDLLLGKFSYMLQQAIIILATKRGEVDLTYNKVDKITIKDILSAQLTKLEHGTTDNLWMSIRNTRNYSRISFSDPHRLTSIIMRDGEKLDMSALSSYLIDTFCEGYIKYLNILRNNGFPGLDVNTLADKLNDMRTNLFETPPYLLNCVDSKGEIVHSNKGSYSVIRSSYELNNLAKHKQNDNTKFYSGKTPAAKHHTVFAKTAIVPSADRAAVSKQNTVSKRNIPRTNGVAASGQSNMLRYIF